MLSIAVKIDARCSRIARSAPRASPSITHCTIARCSEIRARARLASASDRRLTRSSCPLASWITCQARSWPAMRASSRCISSSWRKNRAASFAFIASDCACSVRASSARCASSIRRAARPTSRHSSDSRTKWLSRTLVRSIGATKLPTCGTTSSSPSSARRLNASRTGVRLTPKVSAMRASDSESPGRRATVTICSRRLA